MTTMDREVKKCAVCGSKHEYTVIASTNSFGTPDLDLRPPQMERSTMYLWVQECPDCRYVASNITNKPGKVTKEWLASQAYVTCDGIRFRSGLASRFYKQYKISLLNTKTEQAFCAIHHAAWACDDRRDVKKAMICRDLAIPLIEKLIEKKHENEPDKLSISLCMDVNGKKFWLIHKKSFDPIEHKTPVDVDEHSTGVGDNTIQISGLKDKESVSLDLRKIMDALFAGQIVENNSTFLNPILIVPEFNKIMTA